MMSAPNRRSVIKALLAGTAAFSGVFQSFKNEDAAAPLKGNINHSVCRWCYNQLSLDQLCSEAKKIGIRGIDLAGPKDWSVLKAHGLDSSMCNGAEISLTDGFNDPAFHGTLIRNYTAMIPMVAKAGYKNLICFSGSKRNKSDKTGWKNCQAGLEKLLPLAEKYKVVLVMELLNSKIDHKDYQCDHVEWGVELAKRLDSENFRLLFDIYHMQINEGDLIRNIRSYHSYIAHYHTGGVPGRNEIDSTQEINYPAVMQAIKETGFKGYVAQEFIPKQADKMASLRKAIQICDV